MAPLIQGFHPGYERNGIYPVNIVLAELGNGWAEFDGDCIPITSSRYQLFAKSQVCVTCGIIGVYFAKERSAKSRRDKITKEVVFTATTLKWHFNLYAQKLDGTEVLMTQDHIIPLARGGRNHIGNLQTMCAPCNVKKSDSPAVLSPLLST